MLLTTVERLNCLSVVLQVSGKAPLAQFVRGYASGIRRAQALSSSDFAQFCVDDMCSVGDNSDIPGSYRFSGRGTPYSHRVFYSLLRFSLSGIGSMVLLMGSALVCEEVGFVNIPTTAVSTRDTCSECRHSVPVVVLTSWLTLSADLGANRSGLVAESPV